jgi:hypothetical protein
MAQPHEDRRELYGLRSLADKPSAEVGPHAGGARRRGER